MNHSHISPMPEYFDRYIHLSTNKNYVNSLELSLQEIQSLPLENYLKIGHQVYATNKWTIPDLIQHLIDAERIFCYRALCFARKEPNKQISFDEDQYVVEAKASIRSLQDLIDELIIVRKSTICLFKSFTKEMLLQSGEGFKGPYSVLAIAFIIAGHQKWHLNIIEERYVPLLEM